MTQPFDQANPLGSLQVSLMAAPAILSDNSIVVGDKTGVVTAFNSFLNAFSDSLDCHQRGTFNALPGP
jgi:hypothetical protein